MSQSAFLAPLTPSAFPLLSPAIPSLDPPSAILSDPGSTHNSPRLATLSATLMELLTDAPATPSVTKSVQEEYLMNLASSFENLARQLATPDVFVQRDIVVISDSFGPGGYMSVHANRSIVLSRPKGAHQQPFTPIWDITSGNGLPPRLAISLYQSVVHALGATGVSEEAYAVTAYRVAHQPGKPASTTALRQFYPRAIERINTLSSEADYAVSHPHHFDDPDGLNILAQKAVEYETMANLFQAVISQNGATSVLDTGNGFNMFALPDGSCTIFLYRTPSSPWICLASFIEVKRNGRDEPLHLASHHPVQRTDEDAPAKPKTKAKAKPKTATPPAKAETPAPKKRKSGPSITFRPPTNLEIPGLVPPPSQYQDALAALYSETVTSLGGSGRRKGTLPSPAPKDPLLLWVLYYDVKRQTTSREGVKDRSQSDARNAYIARHTRYANARKAVADGKSIQALAAKHAAKVLSCVGLPSVSPTTLDKAEYPSPEYPIDKEEEEEEEEMMEGGIESIEEVEDDRGVAIAATNRPKLDIVMVEQPDSHAHQDKKARAEIPVVPATPPPPPPVVPPPVEPPAVDHAFAKPSYTLIPVTDRQGALVRPARFVYQPDSSAPAVATVMGRDLSLNSDVRDEVNFVLDTYGISDAEKGEVQDALAAVNPGAPRFRFSLATVTGSANHIKQPFIGSLDDGSGRPRFFRGLDQLAPYLHDMAAILSTHGKPADYIYTLFEEYIAKSRQ